MLILDEVCKFHVACAVLFLLLLLCKRKFIISDAPELSKLLFFFLLLVALLLPALNLECAATVYGSLHLSLFAFVFFKQAVSLVLSLCNLAIEDLFGIVLKRLQLSDLVVNHFLSLVLLFFEFLLFTFFFHVVELLLLLVVLFDFLCLCHVSQSRSFLLLHLLFVNFRQISTVLSNLLKSLNFFLFLPL